MRSRRDPARPAVLAEGRGQGCTGKAGASASGNIPPTAAAGAKPRVRRASVPHIEAPRPYRLRAVVARRPPAGAVVAWERGAHREARVSALVAPLVRNLDAVARHEPDSARADP